MDSGRELVVMISPFLWRLSGMIHVGGGCVMFVTGLAAGVPLLVVISGLDWFDKIWRDAFLVF